MAHYNPIDEDALNATQADYEPFFKMHRPTGAPPPMQGENATAYRRRLAESLQQHAPNTKDFNIRHSTGTAFDVLEKQIKADAQREALHPTVPEGELRQMTRYDAAGRPFYEFFGSPSAWMKDFMPEKKQCIGILNPDAGKFTKGGRDAKCHNPLGQPASTPHRSGRHSTLLVVLRILDHHTWLGLVFLNIISQAIPSYLM